MDIVKTSRILVATLLFAMVWACSDKPNEAVPVEAEFNVLPASGLTTTHFEFDATQTLLPADENNPVLIRYDWQNDGIWDQEYCTKVKVQHRFLKPGNYSVKMEARNMAGLRDTSITGLNIEQGYSPPVAHLLILPDSANRYTQFSFNSSQSFDYEDSTDLLSYRFDFDGDGYWDTDFTSGSAVQHIYPLPGKYLAGVEVKDPTGRSSIIRKPVTVDLLNDSIMPQFSINGGFFTVTDIIQFDASGSKFKDRDDKLLTYSWDIHNDGLWEATNLTTPYLKRIINTIGFVKVKLRVTDGRGLYRDTIQKMEIFPEDSPPEAALVVGNKYGNLQTNYFLHSYGTHDRETSIMDLDYQWDMDGDGFWEPELSNQRQVNYRYSRTGKYTITLKVTDSHLNSSVLKDTLYVFEGKHETGLLIDKRDENLFDYYGIVKIGNRWWMQENLLLEIPPTKYSAGIQPLCYNSNPSWCLQYGGLYLSGSARQICPFGWRLPTRAEFQEMVALEAWGSLANLFLGGSSEMHIMMGGYIDMTGKSLGSGIATHFWLSDSNGYGMPYAWYIDKSKNESKPVIAGGNYGYSIRCVKAD